MGDPIPDLTPAGWAVRRPVGDGHELLLYDDGTVRFKHLCDRGERGLVTCAPALRIGDGHTVSTDWRRPTVTPSILCPDCGTHGFITDGEWRDCG